jgi:hypothetical protein
MVLGAMKYTYIPSLTKIGSGLLELMGGGGGEYIYRHRRTRTQSGR